MATMNILNPDEILFVLDGCAYTRQMAEDYFTEERVAPQKKIRRAHRRRGNRMAAAAAKKAAEMAAILSVRFGCTFKAAFAAAMKSDSYNGAAVLLTEWADKVWNAPHYTYTAKRSARTDLLAGIGTTDAAEEALRVERLLFERAEAALLVGVGTTNAAEEALKQERRLAEAASAAEAGRRHYVAIMARNAVAPRKEVKVRSDRSARKAAREERALAAWASYHAACAAADAGKCQRVWASAHNLPVFWRKEDKAVEAESFKFDLQLFAALASGCASRVNGDCSHESATVESVLEAISGMFAPEVNRVGIRGIDWVDDSRLIEEPVAESVLDDVVFSMFDPEANRRGIAGIDWVDDSRLIEADNAIDIGDEAEEASEGGNVMFKFDLQLFAEENDYLSVIMDCKQDYCGYIVSTHVKSRVDKAMNYVIYNAGVFKNIGIKYVEYIGKRCSTNEALLKDGVSRKEIVSCCGKEIKLAKKNTIVFLANTLNEEQTIALFGSNVNKKIRSIVRRDERVTVDNKEAIIDALYAGKNSGVPTAVVVAKAMENYLSGFAMKNIEAVRKNAIKSFRENYAARALAFVGVEANNENIYDLEKVVNELHGCVDIGEDNRVDNNAAKAIRSAVCKMARHEYQVYSIFIEEELNSEGRIVSTKGSVIPSIDVIGDNAIIEEMIKDNPDIATASGDKYTVFDSVVYKNDESRTVALSDAKLLSCSTYNNAVASREDWFIPKFIKVNLQNVPERIRSAILMDGIKVAGNSICYPRVFDMDFSFGNISCHDRHVDWNIVQMGGVEEDNGKFSLTSEVKVLVEGDKYYDMLNSLPTYYMLEFNNNSVKKGEAFFICSDFTGVMSEETPECEKAKKSRFELIDKSTSGLLTSISKRGSMDYFDFAKAVGRFALTFTSNVKFVNVDAFAYINDDIAKNDDGSATADGWVGLATSAMQRGLRKHGLNLADEAVSQLGLQVRTFKQPVKGFSPCGLSSAMIAGFIACKGEDKIHFVEKSDWAEVYSQAVKDKSLKGHVFVCGITEYEYRHGSLPELIVDKNSLKEEFAIGSDEAITVTVLAVAKSSDAHLNTQFIANNFSNEPDVIGFLGRLGNGLISDKIDNALSVPANAGHVLDMNIKSEVDRISQVAPIMVQADLQWADSKLDSYVNTVSNNTIGKNKYPASGKYIHGTGDVISAVTGFNALKKTEIYAPALGNILDSGEQVVGMRNPKISSNAYWYGQSASINDIICRCAAAVLVGELSVEMARLTVKWYNSLGDGVVVVPPCGDFFKLTGDSDVDYDGFSIFWGKVPRMMRKQEMIGIVPVTATSTSKAYYSFEEHADLFDRIAFGAKESVGTLSNRHAAAEQLKSAMVANKEFRAKVLALAPEIIASSIGLDEVPEAAKHAYKRRFVGIKPDIDNVGNVVYHKVPSYSVDNDIAREVNRAWLLDSDRSFESFCEWLNDIAVVDDSIITRIIDASKKGDNVFTGSMSWISGKYESGRGGKLTVINHATGEDMPAVRFIPLYMDKTAAVSIKSTAIKLDGEAPNACRYEYIPLEEDECLDADKDNRYIKFHSPLSVLRDEMLSEAANKLNKKRKENTEKYKAVYDALLKTIEEKTTRFFSDCYSRPSASYVKSIFGGYYNNVSSREFRAAIKEALIGMTDNCFFMDIIDKNNTRKVVDNICYRNLTLAYVKRFVSRTDNGGESSFYRIAENENVVACTRMAKTVVDIMRRTSMPIEDVITAKYGGYRLSALPGSVYADIDEDTAEDTDEIIGTININGGISDSGLEVIDNAEVSGTFGIVRVAGCLWAVKYINEILDIKRSNVRTDLFAIPVEFTHRDYKSGKMIRVADITERQQRDITKAGKGILSVNAKQQPVLTYGNGKSVAGRAFFGNRNKLHDIVKDAGEVEIVNVIRSRISTIDDDNKSIAKGYPTIIIVRLKK